jgi:hypothetical protein
MVYFKAKLKNNDVNHLVSDPSEAETHQTNVYLYSLYFRFSSRTLKLS